MMIAGTERRRQGCSLQDGKQWGFTVFDPVDYKNVNFTLPLSVNGTFCAFSTGYDPKGSTFLWHSMSHFNNVNVGVTGFVFDSRYTFTGLGYLAVCWQKQWGNLWAGYTEVLNWYFPLTTSQVYDVCLTKHTKNISSGHNWEPARIEEWNNSYARIHPDGEITLVYGQYRSQNLLLAALP